MVVEVVEIGPIIGLAERHSHSEEGDRNLTSLSEVLPIGISASIIFADLTHVWLSVRTCEGWAGEHSMRCKLIKKWGQELTLPVVTHKHCSYLIHAAHVPLANVDRMLMTNFAATNHKWGQ